VCLVFNCSFTGSIFLYRPSLPRILSTKEINDTSISADWLVLNLEVFEIDSIDPGIGSTGITVGMSYVSALVNRILNIMEGIGPSDNQGNPLLVTTLGNATWEAMELDTNWEGENWDITKSNLSFLAGILTFAPNYSYKSNVSWEPFLSSRTRENITFPANLFDFNCSTFS
jgi:hypothetical protein